MALGNYDNNDKDFRPTVYGFSTSNTSESAADITNLSFTMWKSTIKIAIAPAVSGGNGERTEWDRKRAAATYLTPIKAHQFAQILKDFMKDPKTYSGWGVFAGKGLITISDGKEFNANGPCIVIQLISPEGSVDSQFAYELKRDYHRVIESFNGESGEFVDNSDKFQNIELEHIIWQLEDYSRASNNAIAFSVVDNMSWGMNHQNNDLEKIAAKLGVDLGKQKAGNGGNNSYFNKGGNKSATTQSSTIDDILG